MFPINKTCIVLCLFSISFQGKAQQCWSNDTIKMKLALIATDETFPMGYIEKSLQELKIVDSNRLVFERGIVNFNDLAFLNEDILKMKDAVNEWGNKGFKSDQKKDLWKNSSTYTMKEYNCLLQVRTISFEDFYEYQFKLFPVKKFSVHLDTLYMLVKNSVKKTAISLWDQRKDKDTFAIVKIDSLWNLMKDLIQYSEYPLRLRSPLKTSEDSLWNGMANVINDGKITIWNPVEFEKKMFTSSIIRKNIPKDDLRQQINNSLKELFPLSHNSPKARISVDEKTLNGKLMNKTESDIDTIYIVRGESVTLNAKKTLDEDTPKKFLEYYWKHKNPLHANKLEISSDTGVYCQVNPLDTGNFLIILTVDDGIKLKGKKPSAKDSILIISFAPVDIDNYLKLVKVHTVQTAIKYTSSKRYYDYESIAIYPKNKETEFWRPRQVPQIETDSRSLRLKESKLQGDSIIFPIDFINNVSIKEDIKLTVLCDSVSQFKSSVHFKINHKKYFPYYLGLYRFSHQIQADTSLGVNNPKKDYFTPAAYLFVHLWDRFDVGLGINLKQIKWSHPTKDDLKVPIFPEFVFSYKLTKNHFGNFGITGYGAIINSYIKGPDVERQLLMGGRLQLNLTLFNGLGEFSFLIGGPLYLQEGRISKNYCWLGNWVAHLFTKFL